MKKFNSFYWVALALLAVGGLNWGLIGAFNYDLVSSLFGDMTVLTRTVYGLVGVSAIYMVFTALVSLADTTSNTVSKTRVVHP